MNWHKCKNKEVWVEGVRFDDAEGKIDQMKLRCIITNDEIGKTLSIDDGKVQYTIPFERVERYLK